MSQSPLPKRPGARPQTTATNPHSQLTNIPSPSFSDVLLERIAQMPDVELAPSMRAPAGTFGAYLKPGADNGPLASFAVLTKIPKEKRI